MHDTICYKTHVQRFQLRRNKVLLSNLIKIYVFLRTWLILSPGIFLLMDFLIPCLLVFNVYDFVTCIFLRQDLKIK